ncbi:MAG TPA: GlsB/YeaQ/YmgE family stress response membrane protein [Burkholderiales bacterium]|nr:GlsB/YeaQ/YmgE family stress response membrane protein [Burkholderiales bacterium]
MNLIILLVVGGILGWLASIVMKTNNQQGMILNIVVGIVGALLAGYFLAPMFGTGTINSGDFSFSSLLVSLVGAVLLLAIVSMFQRGRLRDSR